MRKESLNPTVGAEDAPSGFSIGLPGFFERGGGAARGSGGPPVDAALEFPEEQEGKTGKIPRSFRRLPVPIEMVRALWAGSVDPDVHYKNWSYEDLPLAGSGTGEGKEEVVSSDSASSEQTEG